MRRLRKFWRLPARDRGLLLIALLLLGAIRLGLALLPFQTVRRLLSRLSRAPAGQMPEENAVRCVVWALDVASHILPGSTSCLPRALAGHLLLARRGVAATLQIGVARGAAGQLEAHAWIEHAGQVVIGALDDLARYQALPALEPEGSTLIR